MKPVQGNPEITDDLLTLYFYNDGLTRAERHAISSAIAADAEIAERYRLLTGDLTAFTDTPAEPIPDDMRARLFDTIDRAARRDAAAVTQPRRGTHLPSFFWGAAVTAALAIGIGLGTWMSGGDDGDATTLPSPTTMAEVIESPAFTRSVRVHFTDSQRELDGLDVASEADRILLVADLIARNRLYEKAADQNGAPDLARVLRAFEPVLVKLAAEDLDAGEAEILLAQLNFELDVMLTKLARDPSDKSGSINEDTRT